MDIGVDYLGIYSIVVLGVMCMFWYDVGNSIELQCLFENFCRNLDGCFFFWCFISQGVIEFCFIEKCCKFEILSVWNLFK